MIQSDYQPTTADPFSTDAPLANVRPRNDFPAAEFVNRPNVPVFTEHETTCTAGRYAGRRLKFGYSELLAVMQRCNRRIEERGDYAGLTLGYHTPPRELIWKGEAKMPPLVGFAGPFRMGQIDTGNGGRVWAILADMHFFRESYWVKLDNGQQISVEKQYPRRSSELWLEERYQDMFLDPITLLSADAPRLDMGLLYSTQSHSGAMCEVYSAAAAPSAASVFVPAVGTTKKHYTDSGETPMALAPEDVQQIVQAIMQTEAMQFLQSLMQQAGDPNGQQPGAPPPGAGAGGPPPGDTMPNTGMDPAPPTPGQAPGAGPMQPMPPGQNPNQQQYSGDDGDDEDDDSLVVKKKPPMGEKEGYSAGQMLQRIRSLESQVEIERYARINEQRRGWLNTRVAEGYPCDVTEEMKIVAASKMDNESWEAYSRQFSIVRQPAPLNQYLESDGSVLRPNGQTSVTADGRIETSAYSLDASNRARAICEAEVAKGNSPDYGTVLQSVVDGKL